jgi:uncharacterized membrane protein YfcA
MLGGGVSGDLLAGHGPLWWSAVGALGLGVGIVAGMFGVGGGFLLTPLLVALFGVPSHLAVGSGLCQMIGTATAAQIRYNRLGQGEAKLGWMMIGGSVLGADLGRQAVGALEDSGTVSVMGRALPATDFWLSLGYLVLLSVVAWWMARDAALAARRANPEPPAPDAPAVMPGPLTRLRLGPRTVLPRSGVSISIALVAYLGFGIGFLSGCSGSGAGWCSCRSCCTASG